MNKSLILSEDDDEAKAAIVQHLKSEGIFDEFRKECLSDVDTKPSFLNLRQRLDGYVSKFLSQQQWSPNLNKNQLRESLRRQINESSMVKYGVEHLVEQVVNSKVQTTFYPKIDDIVKQLLGIKDEQNDIIWPEEEVNDASEQKQSSHVKNELDEDQTTFKPMDEDSNMDIDMDVKPNIEEINSFIASTSQTDSSEHKLFRVKQEEIDSDERSLEMKLQETTLRSSDDESNSINFRTVRDIPMVESSSDASKSQETSSTIESKESSVENKNLSSSNSVKIEKLDTDKKVVKTESKRKSEYEREAKEVSKSKEKQKSESRSQAKAKIIDDNYLSDVSSVHTSDLSDFDDRISLSSEEDDETKKVKISLKEVKQMTDVSALKEKVCSPVDNDSDSNSKTQKRERKVNPKYISSEYSSLFNQKWNENESNIEVSKSKNVTVKTEDSKSAQHLVETTSKNVRQKEEIEESADIPIQTKPKKKLVKQKSESQKRYDASDLYKPRPVIPSRRNRNSAPDQNA
ncbi:biorientation of chromosomes in cell division protein 1-like 1 isoform X1 [Dinothrombium tinctorium]|uniref:Biorientation of chromosomes in cell division protein 1-like 1 isoform X1 n=1 Tax=Dinothrombium tinctorium TaxID=1965070 RepID=A0A443QKY1_9ACAR|nr:biorientation of chromosomes in cell division protein 1-like 1 isoform X1 [Dinothrombium tinctorium]